MFIRPTEIGNLWWFSRSNNQLGSERPSHQETMLAVNASAKHWSVSAHALLILSFLTGRSCHKVAGMVAAVVTVVQEGVSTSHSMNTHPKYPVVFPTHHVQPNRLIASQSKNDINHCSQNITGAATGVSEHLCAFTVGLGVRVSQEHYLVSLRKTLWLRLRRTCCFLFGFKLHTNNSFLPLQTFLLFKLLWLTSLGDQKRYFKIF